MTVDEHPKPQANIEGLGKLPSVFKKNGTVTAGTASVSGFFFLQLNRQNVFKFDFHL